MGEARAWCYNDSIMPELYHLDLSRSKTKGACLAVLPGDPGRVPGIAKALDPKAREIAYKREFRTWISRVEGSPVLVTSTGIGGPSTSIVVDELARVGVRTFLRVGTCGGIQPFMRIGDLVITTGAVRLDGASTHYAPIEYPAVAEHEVVSALIQGAQELGFRFHVGITASSDTFYPGQERKDSFSGYVPRRFQGATREWQKLHVLNYEMEAATLLTVASAIGLRAGCVCGVVDVRSKGKEKISPGALRLVEDRLIRLCSRVVCYLTL